MVDTSSRPDIRARHLGEEARRLASKRDWCHERLIRARVELEEAERAFLEASDAARVAEKARASAESPSYGLR